MIRPSEQTVEHRDFLGQAQGTQRQQIAVHQQLETLRALRRRGRQQVRRVH